jgi:hypothetical protein
VHELELRRRRCDSFGLWLDGLLHAGSIGCR